MPEVGARIPEPGEIVAGKYRLSRLLGEGGMGVVLAAEHLRLRQPIAIKFLNPAMLGVPEIVERFDREARAAATLRSRHVVRVTDVEQTPDGVPYMVMELLDGVDLESEREKRRHLPYDEAVDYVLQACGALAEAHQAGIVHRDLKPGNLFLAREDGDRLIVKVLDFGISKFLKGEDTKLTSAGAIMGTALYMSPEQIRGDASIDARSDIWSLGVILYELIGGDAPWLGPATRVAAGIVSEAAPDLRTRCQIPDGLAHAIHSMLEKNPAHRPQTISDVAFAIAPFAPQGSIGAEVAEHLARRSQRNPASLASGRASTPSSPDLPRLSSSPGLPRLSSSPSLPRVSSSPGLPRLSSSPSYPGSSPSGAPDVERVGPSSSDRFQLVVSTHVNPERSTMAATTSSAHTIGRPRALWGALAGFGALALAGVVLIAFVAGAKGTSTSGVGSSASGTAVVVPEPPRPPPTTPPIEPGPTTTAAVSTPAPTASSPPIAVTAKKPPPQASVAVAHTPAGPATQPAPRPTTKPTEAAPAAVNPPFLK